MKVWFEASTRRIFYVQPQNLTTEEREVDDEALRITGLVIGQRYLNDDGSVRVEEEPALARRRTLEDQMDEAITALETQRDLLVSRAPTAAETRQILLLLVRCVLGLVRLMRNRV